ncbi:MAG: TIGR04282 family arsenosugar biosynthesis glycosyltransferase [Anaerolineae bacterium]
MRRALIVVAKRPVNGQTKTRLTPPFTPHQATALYECLLRDTLELMTQVEGVQPILAYAPEDAAPYFRSICPAAFELCPQCGADLGARLHNALTHALAQGYRQAVIMDSDSPTLPPAYLRQAFAHLDEAGTDVVLGPCDDGGYYLIGLKEPCAALFDITMSTPTVLQQTLAAADAASRRAALLPTWYDVDTVEEVERLRAELAADPAAFAPRTRAMLPSLSWSAGVPLPSLNKTE